MIHDKFIVKNDGKYIEFPGTGSALFQCMDLMRQYIKDVWELDPYIIPRSANARSAWSNARSNSKIEKIPNTPSGVPRKGDIIFFKFYPGLYGFDGHVAIFDKGDVMNVISFDQNYPKYSACHMQRHSYKGCLGWIRKR